MTDTSPFCWHDVAISLIGMTVMVLFSTGVIPL